jgi:identified by metaGeneAnnotator|nr:MAG TPA: tail fiber protein [Caudoviricetes sp.]
MPQPKLLSKAWASDGLKNSIPDTRSGGMPLEGATYADGFPSITMTPISTGGKPPSGKDMNGVLYEISAHTVWQNQGGRYRFDQAFCDAIGGYPKGSVLINDTLDTEYISLVDANTHNPNSGNNTGKWAIHAGKGLKASTMQAGIVQLSSATNSEREDIAATPKAVKTAYDKAVAAESAASGAVKTSGNQDIGGSKTFTAAATFKAGAIVADSVGDFNSNQYLQIGSNNVNSYLYNKKSGKYLSMRNDGELRYDGKRLLNVDDFPAQKATSGYIKTPSGLIFEWGMVQVPIDSYVQVVFPVAFPNACLNVQATAVFDQAVAGATVLSAHVGRINQTGCHVGVSENGIAGPRPVYWLAIGH